MGLFGYSYLWNIHCHYHGRNGSVGWWGGRIHSMDNVGATDIQRMTGLEIDVKD